MGNLRCGECQSVEVVSGEEFIKFGFLIMRSPFSRISKIMGRTETNESAKVLIEIPSSYLMKNGRLVQGSHKSID